MRPLRPQVVAWLLVSTMTNERNRTARRIDESLVEAETRLLARMSEREQDAVLHEAVEAMRRIFDDEPQSGVFRVKNKKLQGVSS